MKRILRFACLPFCLSLAAAAPGPPAVAGPVDGAERKISVSLKETPLRTAIDMAFSGSGLQYSIHPEVQNVPITLQVREASIRQVVRLIVRQAASAIPGLTLALDGDVYSILIAQPAGAGFLAPGGWTKLPLRNLGAADVGELFNAQVIKPSGRISDVKVAANRTGRVPDSGWIVPEGIEGILAITADNSLVVRGTPEAIQAMMALLAHIDVPQSQTALVISAGSLRAETILGEAEEVSLLDSDGARRLEAKVSLQRSAGGLVASVDGLVRINGRTRSFRTRHSVIPGVPIRIATLDSSKGLVPVYLKSAHMPAAVGIGGFGGGGLGGGGFGGGGLGGGLGGGGGGRRF